ncbi:MAG: recombination mediator RecR [Magnetospiraceae bacterium]
MPAPDIDHLIRLVGKLPGLGPRSAKRLVLHLLKKRDSVLIPLTRALEETAARVTPCGTCGNLDTMDPCAICADPKRDTGLLCVVEDVADLWALERSGAYRGRYHVLGGVLSPLDGVDPEDLRIPQLLARAGDGISEVVLATSATVDGQTTAHYIAERLSDRGVIVSGLAHGVPVGGELDYLDEGTLTTALKARRPLG